MGEKGRGRREGREREERGRRRVAEGGSSKIMGGSKVSQ